MTPFLSPELTTIALCWRLDRRDGVAVGFTTHDRDLVIAGLPYRSAPGMVPSAISLSDGFDVDTLDVGGALTDAAISSDELAAGRWDGARLRLFAVDWTEPQGDAVPLARGEFGDVAIRDGAFTAELRGPTALLERPVVEQTSPECRAELGDGRCRVDMAGRRVITTILAADAPDAIRVAATAGGDIYGYGTLRWIDGSNSGLASAILTSTAATICLREVPPFPIGVGDHVELIEGCDKAFGTCRDRFSNQANFRGEPHLAGNDLLTRYPGA